MRDTLKTGMSRTVAQLVAVFTVAFGLLSAQCFAVCAAESCNKVAAAEPVAPIERASSHCHSEPANEQPSAPEERKDCAHESLESGSWQEVKPVAVSFPPSLELQSLPEHTLVIPSVLRDTSASGASPPLTGLVRSTVLRI
jgi:hypothetical protein